MSDELPKGGPARLWRKVGQGARANRDAKPLARAFAGKLGAPKVLTMNRQSDY